MPLLTNVRMIVGEGCDSPEYALGAFETTDDARDDARLPGMRSCWAAADELPDVSSLAIL